MDFLDLFSDEAKHDVDKTVSDNDYIEVIDLKPPSLCKYYQPNPLLYHSKQSGRNYIILTPSHHDYKNIFLYDIQLDEYLVVGKYNNQIDNTDNDFDDIFEFGYQFQNFHPSLHCHCLDPINDKLYIFGGSGNVYGIFDLKQNKWDKLETSSLIKQFEFGISCFIPSKKAIHGYDGNEYLKIKIKEKKNKNKIILKTQNIFGKSGSQVAFMFHSKATNRLVLVGGGNAGTYFFNLGQKTKEKKKKSKKKWIMFGCDVLGKYDCTYLKFFTAFNGNLLLAIPDYGNKMIACDLKYKSEDSGKHQSKSQIINNRLPFDKIMQKDTKVVNITNGKYVHFINMRQRFHFKILFFDLVPLELMRPYIVLATFGFARETIDIYVPTDIVNFIVSFLCLG